MARTAQIFSDNGHQAVRLPQDIHLSGTEVEIRQDQLSGEITLTPRGESAERQKNWDEFVQLVAEIPEEERMNFEIPRNRMPLKARDLF